MKKSILLLGLLFMFSCNNHNVIENYSIDQFYKNTRVGDGYFSMNEDKILISSDKSGIFNVYEVSIEKVTHNQITFSNETSFYPRGYVPGSENFIYSADKEGDELSHLFLFDKEQGSLDLTPGQREKATFFDWSDDKKSMYYLTNARDSNFFDLYKMDVGIWKPKLIYQNNDGMNINDLSNDENMYVLTKTITTSNNKMYLIINDKSKEIDISEKKGSYQSAGFSKNNSHLYYITDVDKEFSYLVSYEISTGEKKIIYQTNWDVMYSYLTKNEQYRVIGVNEDGKNKVFLINSETMKVVDFSNLPEGNVLGVNISESEKKVILTIGTSKSPNNIYVYNFESKDLIKLTNTLNPEINSENLVMSEVVRFKSFDGLEIPAIYYKPLNATKLNKVPALVWVHGGPGGQSRVGYSPLIQFLVNNGYAILAVNNRGSSGYGKTFNKMDDLNHGDKDLRDCIYGKKWLQENDYIKKENIGIIGGSYGGYMTMAAMTFTPDEFKVGINIFGVTNWLRTLKSIPPYWESQREALYKELGDPYSKDSVRLRKISPLFHAEKVKNPIMVLQGANDPRVLQVESDEIVEELKKNNIPVEYVLFTDEGHGFRKKENEINGYSKILFFLEKYMN